jgi:phosphoribosylaminoimidazole-succinocarboxamide synthase
MEVCYGSEDRQRQCPRDILCFDDRLLIVTTDRISAFDVILPTPIPDKAGSEQAFAVWV